MGLPICVESYRQQVCCRTDVKPDTHPKGGPVVLGRLPTTSFLTATTLIYTVGAGITAAAGTRLALQQILGDGLIYAIGVGITAASGTRLALQ